MLAAEFQNNIDRIWETFRSAGISNPLEVAEQITYLLFIKKLDVGDRERQATSLPDGAKSNSVFPEDREDLRWSNFKNADPTEMFEIVSQRIFPLLRTLGDRHSAFSRQLRGARFTVANPSLLARIVDLLDEVQLEDDTSPQLYEYILGKIATSGYSGQFYTPRHIIRLMVEMMAPKPDDAICDPACGTAGFLTASADYLARRYPETKQKLLQQEGLQGGLFHGFDFDSTMLRIGSMNMLLHGHAHPDIRYKDSLSQTSDADSEQYSLILSNPPFGGSVDADGTSANLQRVIRTKKAELLFITLSIQLLKPGGRAAIIVPEGVLFGSSKAHKELRRILVEEQKLEGLVKLPAGAFRPFSGTSAAILVFTKTNSGGTDGVWFYDVATDGWSLDDKRTPLLAEEKLGPVTGIRLNESDHVKNNLPDVLARWLRRDKSERTRKRTDQSFVVSKDDIVAQDYDLSLQRYQESLEQEQLRQGKAHRLGDFAEIFSGWVEASDLDNAESRPEAPQEVRVLHPTLLTSDLPPVSRLPVRRTNREPKNRLRKGDIVGRDLAELRHWTVLPESYDGVQAGRGIVAIRLTQEVLPPEYLVAYLSSRQAERQLPRYNVIPRLQPAGVADTLIPLCDGSSPSIGSAISKVNDAVREIGLMQAEVRASQDRVFENCSSAERRARLEKAAELSSLTAQNLRKQRHPLQVFQDTYPYAIARAVRKLRHSMTLREKHESAILCAESLILSLGIVSLSVCAERGWQDLREVAEWSKSVQRGGLSLGHWVGVIRAVGNFARERRDDAAGLADGTASQKGGKGLMADLSSLVTMRNKIRHGGGPRTEAEVTKSLRDLEHLLVKALSGSAFLARTKWVYMTRLRWSSNGDLFSMSGLAIMGDHPDFEPIEFDALRPLEDKQLYLVSQSGEKFELAPFCMLDDCPSCLTPELYYPDRLTGSAALLKSLDRGHELESESVYNAMLSWMDR
ncbi:class I SAM-dependent DNA methyltransferase [Micromonospora tulbaghiae]|uniref:class I SAM-dependent DNA methyltransferase n=1 Tax=Micromonospora tulbaghiae TaxID=479978 RepID=UPI0037149ABB